MSWLSFILGGATAALIISYFDADKPEPETEREIVVNDFSGRFVTLSCQTCRKLKRHRELEANLFECVKCKRQTDIRVS
jgi:hypothetical protein